MTVFLICMIPISGMLGFMLCAMLSVASAADRQEETNIGSSDHDSERKEEA